MKTRKILAVGAVLIGTAAVVTLWPDSPVVPVAQVQAPVAPVSGQESVNASPSGESGSSGKIAATPVAAANAAADFGQWVTQPVPEPDMAKIAAFDNWLERWRKSDDRAAMAEEGKTLAAARRTEFKSLIAKDPRQALERAVARVVRQDLPLEIVAELETPVSKKGNLDVYYGRPPEGGTLPDEPLVLRYFSVDGTDFKARVFGQMEDVSSRKGIPLRGVAIDRELAVAESPLRQLEVGERVPAGTVVEDVCPVSGKTTEAVSEGTAVAENTPTVEVAGQLITLCNGSHVTVLDEKYRTLVQAAGSGSSFFMDAHPGTAATAIGNLRCLYIRAAYPEQMTAPNTEDQAEADMRNNARFFQEASFGKLTATYTITPLITLPQTLRWYQDKDAELNGLGQIHSDARNLARKLGYDTTQYHCIILRVNGGLRGGSSWGGGSSVWLGWGGMDVINHEVGHSLGLGHANYWATTDGTPYGNGANQEYGNGFDVMGGGGGFSAHYGAPVKRNLGWLPTSYVSYPATDGVYRIHAFDQPRLEEGKRYGLNVAKNASIAYDLEYRSSNPTLANQAMVLYGGRLIDTTQGTPAGKSDGGIQIGQTFSDVESDQHFTVVAKNATEPASLDIAYNRGPFPANVAPTTALAATATSVAVGTSVTFTATANDPNGDPLAYHWQFSDGVNGSNSPVFSRTFTSVGFVVARLTVSDMKGGTARASVLITVGTPTTRTISGVVTAAGAPVPGVLVSEASNFTYTNQDGSYTLANVATGTRTLSASLAGYSFTPGFTNPMTVSSSVTNANWTAGVTSFVSLTKVADATEGGSTGTFRLTRSGDPSAALAVNVAALAGTAVKTTDFTLSPDIASNTLTIPAGAASLDVVVTAVNDTAPEGPETVRLQVVSGAGYWSTSGNTAVLTVIDNDTTLPQVAVTAPDPTAMEPADHGALLFTRTGSTSAALNLTVTWSGSATNGSDVQTLPAVVTIPAGQGSVSVPVTVIDDALVEIPENVVATLSASSAYVLDVSAVSAAVVISDDDTPRVTIAAVKPNASEGGQDAGVLLVSRTGSPAAPLKVYYGLSGSAAHGTDYAALTGELIIPAGAISAPIVISPYDDSIGESPETVTVTVASYNNSYSSAIPCQATVTISDNGDKPVISVRNGTIGTEGGSNSTLVFRSVGTAAGNVTVNYTVSGTATAGVDYTALSGTVTVPASGPADVTVTIPLINDVVAEGTESVLVAITPDSAYSIYNDGSATALIRDNDSGSERVGLSANHNDASEAGTAGVFYFYRTGTSGNLTVNYSLAGTATNGSDYASLPGTVVIPDGSLGVNVNITPVDDSLAEGSETVTATVLAGSGYSADFPGTDTIEIADNDTSAVTVGFAQVVSSTTELPDANGQFRDFNVVLSAASTDTIAVTCVGASGSTASGDDIDWAFVNPAAGNALVPLVKLVFPPGTTTQSVRIRVKDDGFAEPTETVALELVSPEKASLTPNKALYLLYLSDSVEPQFATEERWAGGTIYTNQSWSSASPIYTGLLPGFTPLQNVADNYSRRITGQVVAPTTGNYTFWIASDDASRLYLSTTSSVVNKAQIASVSGYTSFQAWDANGSQKSATIALTAGQSYYMEVQHQEGGGGDHASVAWEGPGFTRKPISFEAPDESPRTLRFAAAAATVSETAGSDPLLMVILDRPAGATPVTVDYTVGGTATVGSDFTLAPGMVTFAPGEQMKLLPLAVASDSIGEAPEAIVVALANPSGAQLGIPATHVVTVVDAAVPQVATLFATAASTQSAGTPLGTLAATVPAGRSVASWSILAGNTGGAFSIDVNGAVSLATPSALPDPGSMQLVVRVTDNTGSTGDGYVNVVCNAPGNGVNEQRWTGTATYWDETWTTAPAYSGSLATFTTGQGVADNYSRRLRGFIKPTVTGDFTFWVASDDDSRLYIALDGSPANKIQIATVSGYTGFQSWDSQAGQKSVTIPLVAGNVYFLEAQQAEGGGGDHLSVAWEGPGVSRQAIPAAVIFPFVDGTDFDHPPVPPMLALTSPAGGAEFQTGTAISLQASLAAGSVSVTAVEFYQGSTLIGSDSSAPYSISWTDAPAGNHLLSARAIYAGGSVTGAAVAVSVTNPDPAADPDGDGFNTGLELALGTDPNSAGSYPPASFAGLRAWWKFDEATGTVAADTTGRPQDAAISGAAWTTGVDGAALSFDGSNDGVLAGTAAAMLGTTDFTLGAWVKLDALAGTVTVLQQREPGGSGYLGEYMLNVNGNGTVNFFVYGSGGYQFNITTTATVNAGQWHYLAAVRQGTDGRVYIDGALAATGSGTIQALQSRAVSIGYDYRDSNKYLDGTIDDIRLYERALSGTEIAALFEEWAPNRAPVFAANPLVEAAATEDAAYSVSLAGDVSDPDAGDVVTFSKISGPAWLGVSSSGALSGTPANSDVGANTFVIRATDTGGLSAETTVSISVINVNDAPVFTSSTIIGAVARTGNAYSASLAGSATDPDVGDTLVYSKASGPSWLAVASGGALSGTPGIADAGAQSFVVQVADPAGAQATATLQITVNAVLPGGWSSQDIGTVGTPGQSAEAGGIYSLTASGTGIDSTVDSFRFAWQTLSGDGEIRARITSTSGTTDPLVGVMVRETTGTGSKYYFCGRNGAGLMHGKYRSSTNGSVTTTNKVTKALPVWVRIVRSGNSLTGYRSDNGTSWTPVSSRNISMASQISIGLAVCGRDGSNTASATFDNVTVVP